ncbi:MAG: SUMF1/EgtB/PvdO family nonheme iron enzyme [Acidobacteriota bacterium]
MLGADFETASFGWDNEFPQLEVEVGDFLIDRTPVRNGEFLAFIDDGGYRRRELWRDEDWQWRERVGLEHPAFWSRDNGSFWYQTLFDSLPLDKVVDWPIFVSHAEAECGARPAPRELRFPTLGADPGRALF